MTIGWYYSALAQRVATSALCIRASPGGVREERTLVVAGTVGGTALVCCLHARSRRSPFIHRARRQRTYRLDSSPRIPSLPGAEGPVSSTSLATFLAMPMYTTATATLALLATGASLVAAASTPGANIQNIVKRSPAPTNEEPQSFIESHFANEHHIQSFDLGSFFSVHDLNRDGVLDRSEIEAIYGVHHSLSAKHSENHEVHDAKADKIVRTVLDRIDKDKDGLITKREFIAAGKNGLPAFPEFGKNALGHHYDEESEFFMHHEEIYHNTPETQRKEAYNHPEDLEHFAHHDAIERKEEERERYAEGMPTIEEDEKLRKAAEAKGEKYVSPYEQQIPKEGSPAPVHEQWNAHAGGHAASEAAANVQHVFKGPNGRHIVNTKTDQAINAQQAALEHDLKPDRMEGETDQGYQDRLAAAKEAYEARKAASAINVDTAVPHQANETPEEYERRISKARFEAAKARPGIAPPAGKGKAPNKVSERAPASERVSKQLTISIRPCSTRPLVGKRKRAPSLASSKQSKFTLVRWFRAMRCSGHPSLFAY